MTRPNHIGTLFLTKMYLRRTIPVNNVYICGYLYEKYRSTLMAPFIINEMSVHHAVCLKSEVSNINNLRFCRAQPQPQLQLSWAEIALISVEFWATHPPHTSSFEVLQRYR